MPPRAVAADLGLSYDEVIDIASRHGYPEPDKMLWAIDHIQDSLDGKPSSDAPAAQAPGPRPAPPAVPATTVDDDSLEALLAAAAASDKKRTRNAGEKIADLVQQLRATVTAEVAEREAAAEQQAAAKESLERIAALEAELAKERAALGLAPTATKKTRSYTLPRGDFPCPLCDRHFDTEQGRRMHNTRTHRDAA
jgi:DNA repair exonuclease SbcCD ATPase subunit